MNKNKNASSSSSASARSIELFSLSLEEGNEESTATKNCKKEKSNENMMLGIIRAQVTHPSNRCSNNVDKTLSAEPVEFVDIDFTNFMVKRIAIDCDTDNEIVECIDDKDAIKDHSTELFRQTLAHNILSNTKNFGTNDGKIGDEASNRIIFIN